MMQVDFAIITIREDEFKAVLERFPRKAQKGASGRTYGIAQVKTQTGQDCTVAIVRYVEQGIDTAQRVASDVIADLDPQILLVVGIAGGVPSDNFTLGDVIISSRIDNFNVSKREEDGTEKLNMKSGIHPIISDIAASLLLFQEQLAGWNDSSSIKLKRPEVALQQFETDEMRTKLANGQKNASWYREVRASMTMHFGSEESRTRDPLFKTGRIASSNHLIRNIDSLIQWLQDVGSIQAVEMESAGIYQATQTIFKQYPVMAIRGISNIIGFEGDYQWTKYACQTAAALTYAFVTADIVTPRSSSTVTRKGKVASILSPFAQKPAQSPQPQNSRQASDTEPIEVFISYSQDDEKFKNELDKHLKLLQRQNIIRSWHSQQLGLGRGWEKEIASYIDSAQIILLLISPSFLAADQLYEREIMYTIKRQQSGDAVRIIPIVIRAADLTDTPFQGLQALPRNGRPVETSDNNGAWNKIAQEIQQVSEQLRNN